MPDSLAPVASSCRHLSAWLGTDPNLAVPLDEAALGRLGQALIEIGLTCARGGHQAEFRAALVKALAAASSGPLLHGTDEDVFVLSQSLRQELYLEILQLRRAVLRDVDAGAFRD